MSEQEAIYKHQMHSMYNVEKQWNPHDVTGVRGLTQAQVKLLDEKKVEYRVNNETYLRQHPELQNMVSVFLFKVLEEKPKDILNYAGKYFDQPDLACLIEIESKHYDTNK